MHDLIYKQCELSVSSKAKITGMRTGDTREVIQHYDSAREAREFVTEVAVLQELTAFSLGPQFKRTGH